MKYSTICMILGLTATFEIKDGKIDLSQEQIKKLQDFHKEKTGNELKLEGLEFDKDGFTSLLESELDSVEAALKTANETKKAPEKSPETPDGATEDKSAKELSEMKAALKKLEESNKKLEATVEALIDEPEAVVIKVNQNSDDMSKTALQPWDKIDATRPWNIKAKAQADVVSLSDLGFEIKATTSTDYTALVSDFGDYYRTRFSDDIKSFITEMDDLRKWFPMYSNIQDEEVIVSAFLGEFSQAYQKTWTTKGSYAFQGEKVKMYDVKFDHEFTEMKKLEKNWLGYLNNNGSDAIKMPFVKYLLKETIKKLINEQQIRRMKGVYGAPSTGVAGSAINAANGLLKFIKTKITEKKIKTFATGGFTSTTIVDRVLEDALLIPEHIRDNTQIVCYMSMQAKYWYMKKLESLHGTQQDYKPGETKLKFLDNITVIALPNMGSSQRLIFTIDGNIILCEDKPNEMFDIKFEQEDRKLKVWSDWKESVHIIMVGKKWDDIADADYEHQMIWCNNIDEPDDYFIAMTADDTTPSVLEHTSLVSVANTGATAITDIDDMAVGDTVILKCGSDTNAITIAAAGNFANISAAWTPVAGETITLYKRAAADIVELARTTVEDDAIALTKDDATPDVSAGTVFITVANDAACAITDLDNPTVGETYTIYGGSDTNSTTIADAGNFNLTAAMTLSDGAWIKLYCYADNSYVELARG